MSVDSNQAKLHLHHKLGTLKREVAVARKENFGCFLGLQDTVSGVQWVSAISCLCV